VEQLAKQQGSVKAGGLLLSHWFLLWLFIHSEGGSNMRSVKAGSLLLSHVSAWVVLQTLRWR
jgi:hypothetical protein